MSSRQILGRLMLLDFHDVAHTPEKNDPQHNIPLLLVNFWNTYACFDMGYVAQGLWTIALIFSAC